MTTPRTELMTVREMIDAAIVFDIDEPVVNFKMIESVLIIIASQLNVLGRRALVRYREVKQALAKQLAKGKTTLAVTQIKIHGKAAKKNKDSSTAESTTEKSSSSAKKTHYKRGRSRSRSRSKSKDKSAKGKRRYKEDRMDVVHEKLLVVSRTSHEGQRDHRKSIVTQDQYDRILAEVRKLQVKFGVIPNADTNWSNLHKPTSFTDPKAAMNLATKLEASHKKLNEMLVVITKFASSIPGIDLEGLFDGEFHKPSKETPSFQTLQTSSKTSTAITESEELVPDTDKPPEEEIDEENLATWPELDNDMSNIRQTVLKHMSEAVSAAADTAKRANVLFKESAPRVSEASIINIKFAKLRILVDRFTNKANDLDISMASQMSDAQESVSNMQYKVELMVERIDDYLAHPAEDPAAVAAIKDEFSDMQFDLANAKNSQTNLQELHKQSAADFERLRKRLEMIGQVKTTREEALEALKNKAKVDAVNGLLSRDQLCAVVGYLQGEIRHTNNHIESGELNWQLTLDDYVTYLNEKCDRVQVITLNHSLRDYYKMMSAKVNTMLNIVGELPVNVYKKKLDRDGNCLSCGTPADVIVSDETLELAKHMLSRQAAKPKTDLEVISPKPCTPGRPIPHAPDPRAIVCERYCGASLSKTAESLSSSLGLDVTDINPSHRTGMQKKVHLTCTPCTQSEETFFK